MTSLYRLKGLALMKWSVFTMEKKKKESLCQEDNAQPDPVSEKQKPWFHLFCHL